MAYLLPLNIKLRLEEKKEEEGGKKTQQLKCFKKVVY